MSPVKCENVFLLKTPRLQSWKAAAYIYFIFPDGSVHLSSSVWWCPCKGTGTVCESVCHLNWSPGSVCRHIWEIQSAEWNCTGAGGSWQTVKLTNADKLTDTIGSRQHRLTGTPFKQVFPRCRFNAAFNHNPGLCILWFMLLFCWAQYICLSE